MTKRILKFFAVITIMIAIVLLSSIVNADCYLYDQEYCSEFPIEGDLVWWFSNCSCSDGLPVYDNVCSRSTWHDADTPDWCTSNFPYNTEECDNVCQGTKTTLCTSAPDEDCQNYYSCQGGCHQCISYNNICLESEWEFGSNLFLPDNPGLGNCGTLLTYSPCKECPPSQTCGVECCASWESCCNGECCASWESCCNGECCASWDSCCNGDCCDTSEGQECVGNPEHCCIHECDYGQKKCDGSYSYECVTVNGCREWQFQQTCPTSDTYCDVGDYCGDKQCTDSNYLCREGCQDGCYTWIEDNPSICPWDGETTITINERCLDDSTIVADSVTLKCPPTIREEVILDNNPPLLSKQEGVCQNQNWICHDDGTNVYWIEDYSKVPNYESPEATCNDNLDNDCNAESDYDSSDGRHGDIECPVSVTGMVIPNPVCLGNSFTLGCISSVPRVNSIEEWFGDGECTSFDSWDGNTALFTCNAGQIPGPKTAYCYVDPEKSYVEGGTIQNTILVSECLESCGNGTCDAMMGENCWTCSEDCPCGGQDLFYACINNINQYIKRNYFCEITGCSYTDTILTTDCEELYCVANPTKCVDPLTWQDLSGTVITNANIGNTVFMVYKGGKDSVDQPFSIYEKDGWLNPDDAITDITGIVQTPDLIGIWTITQADLDKTNNYKHFRFSINGKESGPLEISLTPSNNPPTITDIFPPCGYNTTTETKEEISFNVSDSYDFVKGSVTINGIIAYSFPESVGGIHTFPYTFNQPGTSVIIFYAENSGGQNVSIQSNIIVIDTSIDGDYIASCIKSPENFEHITTGLINFDASTTTAIKHNATGSTPIDFSELLFKWTFSDGSTHPNHDGADPFSWNFTKIIRDFGKNSVTLEVELK